MVIPERHDPPYTKAIIIFLLASRLGKVYTFSSSIFMGVGAISHGPLFITNLLSLSYGKYLEHSPPPHTLESAVTIPGVYLFLLVKVA